MKLSVMLGGPIVSLLIGAIIIGCSQNANSLSENPERKNAQRTVVNYDTNDGFSKTYDCDSDILVILSVRDSIAVVKRNDLTEKGKVEFRMHCPL